VNCAQSLYFGFFIATLIFIPFLYRWKIFSVSDVQKSGMHLGVFVPLIAFCLYIGSFLLLPSTFEYLFNQISRFRIFSFSSAFIKSFTQIGTIIFSTILLVGYSCVISKEIKSGIWGSEGAFSKNARNFFMGALYCVILYPLIMFSTQTIRILIDLWTHFSRSEQIALSELLAIKEYPILFWSFCILIVCVVPVLEELLFRGFFQNFFVQIFGKHGGVIIASALFAFFHYSAKQGATNIELLIGLFVFAYAIGNMYLKSRSLYTAIGMHATFNLLSIIFVLLIS